MNRKGLHKILCAVCDLPLMLVSVVEVLEPQAWVDFLCGPCSTIECIEVEPIIEYKSDDPALDAKFSHMLRSAGIHYDSL